MPEEESVAVDTLGQQGPEGDIVDGDTPATVTVIPSPVIDLDQLFQNKETASKLQSMIDRRVEGMRKAERERAKRERDEQMQHEADERARQEWNNLLQTASGDDYDDAAVTARRRILNQLVSRAQEEEWRRSQIPRIQSEVLTPAMESLREQYDEGLRQIPELRGINKS